MINQIQVALDESALDELGDRLIWAYNQALPHLPIGFEPGSSS